MQRLKRDTETGRALASGSGQLAAAVKPPAMSRKVWLGISAAVVLLIAAGIVAGTYLRRHQASPLSQNDTVILANFANTTGDSIFDDTLRQGILTQLEQSPFFNLVTDQKIHALLRETGHSPREALTPEILTALCQKTASKAYLTGSISGGVSVYEIGLTASDCRTGASLAEAKVSANGKDQVLGALDGLTTEMRQRLGEPKSSIEQYNTPVARAATASLEAMKAYTSGRKAAGTGDFTSAMPQFREATRLDPNFAAPYTMLALCYYAVGDEALAAESTKKAFELRDRVSARQKFQIESHYYEVVNGDLEKARQTYELAEQTYPGDALMPLHLWDIYSSLGLYDKGVEVARKAAALDPGSTVSYVTLANAYLEAHRLDEARVVIDEALSKKRDSAQLHIFLYQIAFLQGDAPGVDEQVTWATGKPRVQDIMTKMEADRAGYHGRMEKARELSKKAVAGSEKSEDREQAGRWETEAALREALSGNSTEARTQVAAALAQSKDRDLEYGAALALAYVKEVAKAETLADDLAKRFPEDTLVQFNYLPTIRAEISLSRNEPAAAVETLRAALPYEFGNTGTSDLALYPVYVRGEAYLAWHQGAHAVAEFQKILDHRGVVQLEPIGSLAQLRMAQAYAEQKDNVDARVAYQDFFVLWKDCDPNLSLMKQARAEYAKLQ